MAAPTLFSIELAGEKFIPGTETWKTLTYGALLATYLSGETDGADYQVTAAKTFYCVGLLVLGNSGIGTFTLSQCDAADSATGEVVKIVHTAPADVTVRYWLPTPHLPSFAATKFVNIKTSNATNPTKVVVYGYEV